MFLFLIPIVEVIKEIIASVTTVVLIGLAGLTLAGSAVALIVSTPLFIIFSPILVPATLATGLLATGVSAGASLGVTALSLFLWLIKSCVMSMVSPLSASVMIHVPKGRYGKPWKGGKPYHGKFGGKPFPGSFGGEPYPLIGGPGKFEGPGKFGGGPFPKFGGPGKFGGRADPKMFGGKPIPRGFTVGRGYNGQVVLMGESQSTGDGKWSFNLGPVKPSGGFNWTLNWNKGLPKGEIKWTGSALGKSFKGTIPIGGAAGSGNASSMTESGGGAAPPAGGAAPAPGGAAPPAGGAAPAPGGAAPAAKGAPAPAAKPKV